MKLEEVQEDKLPLIVKSPLASSLDKLQEEVDQVSMSDNESEDKPKNCTCAATILAADDNALNLIPLEILLQTMGIICDTANGG